MRLEIRVPHKFARCELRAGSLHVAPGEGWNVFVTPMAAAEPDPAACMRLALRREVPAEVSVRVLSSATMTTDEGWPVSFMEAEIPEERRIAAYIQAFDYSIALLSRCLSPDAQKAWREGTMTLLRQAHVDLEADRPEVACLADLLQGVAISPSGTQPLVVD